VTTADKRQILTDQAAHLRQLVEEVERARDEFDRETRAEQQAETKPRRRQPVAMVQIMHEHADVLGPIFQQVSELILGDLTEAIAKANHDHYLEHSRQDHARFTAICDELRADVEEARELARKMHGLLGEAERQVTQYRQASTVQVAAIERIGHEKDRLVAQLDEANTLVRELSAQVEAGKSPLVEEPAECPDGGPFECTAPSSHPRLTETWAVPRCLRNRWDQVEADQDATAPAIYCVSEHCARCNAYRREAGLPELSPNQWLQELTVRQAVELPETQEALKLLRIGSPAVLSAEARAQMDAEQSYPEVTTPEGTTSPPETASVWFAGSGAPETAATSG
jgi:hypothetical protein